MPLILPNPYLANRLVNFESTGDNIVINLKKFDGASAAPSILKFPAPRSIQKLKIWSRPTFRGMYAGWRSSSSSFLFFTPSASSSETIFSSFEASSSDCSRSLMFTNVIQTRCRFLFEPFLTTSFRHLVVFPFLWRIIFLDLEVFQFRLQIRRFFRLLFLRGLFGHLLIFFFFFLFCFLFVGRFFLL